MSCKDGHRSHTTDCPECGHADCGECIKLRAEVERLKKQLPTFNYDAERARIGMELQLQEAQKKAAEFDEHKKTCPRFAKFHDIEEFYKD